MKISIAQFAVRRGDANANLARISELSAEAASIGTDLLCLPEMCTTGFDWVSNCEHLRDASRSIAQLKGIAQKHRYSHLRIIFRKDGIGKCGQLFSLH